MQSISLDLPKSNGRTRLRSLRLTDLRRFAEYRADPGLAEFQSWEPMSQEAAEAFLSETAGATCFKPGEWIQLAVADVASDELVGDVGLFLSADRTYVELGFTSARREQGKGHATRAAELAIEQAFRLASIIEVRAITDQLNQASIAVLQRAQFTPSGTQAAQFKGKPCVEALFVRLRGDA